MSALTLTISFPTRGRLISIPNKTLNLSIILMHILPVLKALSNPLLKFSITTTMFQLCG